MYIRYHVHISLQSDLSQPWWPWKVWALSVRKLQQTSGMAETWTAMATIPYCAYTCHNLLWYIMVPLNIDIYAHSWSVRCILFMYIYVCKLNAWPLYDPNPVPNNINKERIHVCRMFLPTEHWENHYSLQTPGTLSISNPKPQKQGNKRRPFGNFVQSNGGSSAMHPTSSHQGAWNTWNTRCQWWGVPYLDKLPFGSPNIRPQCHNEWWRYDM